MLGVGSCPDTLMSTWNRNDGG